MKRKIMFRAYQDQDSKYLEDIIRETWNYDEFCSPKTAKKLARIFLYSCLANQTYTQVAVADHVPAGIIMGKNRRTHRCPLKFRLKQMASIFTLLMTKEGRKVFSMFGSINDIDKELLKRRGKKYSGELAFFAVKAECRGEGLGKKLFQSLVSYMESEHIPEFYLYTDTSCNFAFYECQGMKRCGEQEQTFQIGGTQAKMTFYLYEYRCPKPRKKKGAVNQAPGYQLQS